MKCKRKMQKRRDVLTVIGMMILLAFILRMWPILLLMLIGVFSTHYGCCSTWTRRLSSRLRLRLWRSLRLRRRSRC